MLFANFLKTHQQQLQNDKQLLLLPRRQLVTYALYALIAVAFLHFCSSTLRPHLRSQWWRREYRRRRSQQLSQLGLMRASSCFLLLPHLTDEM